MSDISDTSTDRPDGSDRPDRTQRSTIALVAAALLLVVVVVLVLVFGIARPPALPNLTDQPDPAPSAAVAWTSYDGDDGACLYVARTDGTTEPLECNNLDGQVWAWDDDGIAVFIYGPRDALQIIDPATGEIVERREVDAVDGIEGRQPPMPSPGGTVS
ncbi:MAG: hypothetical protein LC679_09025, partial [Intrasporangiaceae bacterium]|nr:hypothetical protein [Intrasporangiaceae bacterium]